MIKLYKYTVKDSVHYTENCSVISLKTERDGSSQCWKFKARQKGQSKIKGNWWTGIHLKESTPLAKALQKTAGNVIFTEPDQKPCNKVCSKDDVSNTATF